MKGDKTRAFLTLFLIIVGSLTVMGRGISPHATANLNIEKVLNSPEMIEMMEITRGWSMTEVIFNES
ncbi:MAG: hypothetical protein HWN66_08040, partial [Candidatus Helarchaeota archaeon]|nr:hypothetical protein [Candidatus Helarchaeota archaeon]